MTYDTIKFSWIPVKVQAKGSLNDADPDFLALGPAMGVLQFAFSPQDARQVVQLW